MQYPTVAQMRNAERNKPMAQPKVVEPVQQEFSFANRFDEIADKELDKDVVSLLKLLNKFRCSEQAVDHIMRTISPHSPDVKYHQKDPKAKD